LLAVTGFDPTYKDKTMGMLGQLTLRFTVRKILHLFADIM